MDEGGWVGGETNERIVVTGRAAVAVAADPEGEGAVGREGEGARDSAGDGGGVDELRKVWPASESWRRAWEGGASAVLMDGLSGRPRPRSSRPGRSGGEGGGDGGGGAGMT